MAMTNKKLSRSEKILIVMLTVALMAVVLNWEEIEQGFVSGWKRYNIETWFGK